LGDVVHPVRTLPRRWLESSTVTVDRFYPALLLVFLVSLLSIRADRSEVFAGTTVYHISRFHTLVFGINNSSSGEMPYVCVKPLYLGPSVLFRVEHSKNDHHNECSPTTLFGAASAKSFSGKWMLIRYWHNARTPAFGL
jgi:hypothetical protein